MERVEIEVGRLNWDLYNIGKVAAHGLTAKEVEEVANNEPRFFTNLPGRSAEYAMIGPDAANRFIFAAIIPSTDDDDAWYVVMAFRMSRRRALKTYGRG